MTARIYSADAVWTGSAGSRVPGGAVVVDNGTIAWVGPLSELPDAYTGLAVQHHPGATILPGLVESHAHLGYDGLPGAKPRSFGRSAPALVGVMLASARRLLSVGVTTARDLGSRDGLSIEARDLVAEGVARGPRLVVSGAQITTTGGHTWQNNARADSPDELRTLVRRQHRAGVDLIKVNATGGFLTAGSAPARAQFSVGELSTVVGEAHRLGKRVAAHAHGVEGIRNAVAAGVDSLEHCTFVAEDGSIAPDLALIDTIAERGIYVCPTTTHGLPAMVRSNPSFTPPVALLADRGVKIVAGNDAGVDGVPHEAYVGGLEALAWFGLDPEDVLIAATSRAAEALALSTVAGSLRAGMSADLIAVTGDPLTTLSALRDLEFVVARGIEFVPDAIAVPGPDPFVLADLAERNADRRPAPAHASQLTEGSRA